MRHTIIIALLLITLFPNTALAQWGFDAVSVEAYINDHKKQRSLLLARSTLEYSNQLLHEYSSEEVGKYKELNVDNTSDRYVLPWLETVKEIAPRQVMIYTIDRETPDHDLEKATHEELDRIGKLIKDSGIPVSVSY